MAFIRGSSRIDLHLRRTRVIHVLTAAITAKGDHMNTAIEGTPTTEKPKATKKANVPALCANVGLFRGLWLLGGGRAFNSCIHVISFRGNRRGEDMNHSGAPKMQVNSRRTANESHR